MPLINDDMLQQVREEFEKHLKSNVELIAFTSESVECRYCAEVVEICKDLATVTDKISVLTYTQEASPDKIEEYKVSKYPAIVISRPGSSSGRIKYYGLPSGYEFGSLVEDIKMVSANEPVVSSKAMEIISKIDKPVNIKVFVTTTCPYCPRAVGVAHKFAMVNENITGEMIEASEFSEDTANYGVSSVPHIVINGDVQFVGARPDDEFAQFILEAYNHI